MEAVWQGCVESSPACGQKTPFEQSRCTASAGGAEQGSAGSWLQRRPMDPTARGPAHRTDHRHPVSSRSRLEDTRRDELDRAETRTTSQRAESHSGRVLENSTLAAAKKTLLASAPGSSSKTKPDSPSNP